MNNILEIKNLNYSFNQTLVLNNISLVLNPGDFLGLIGPNGSGKTTLLKLILGLYKMQSGEILINNTSIKNFNNWSFLSYIPQKATNISHSFPATVKEIVSMGLLVNKKFPKFVNIQDNILINLALQKVGMQDFVNYRIGELSGGQQQRVIIARALISNPKLLILDEPTTGIDAKNKQEFYNLLAQLNQQGVTLLLVSHDIGKITKYVTKIASLNQHLEFYGSHQDFCAYDKSHRHSNKLEHKLCLH